MSRVNGRWRAPSPPSAIRGLTSPTAGSSPTAASQGRLMIPALPVRRSIPGTTDLSHNGQRIDGGCRLLVAEIHRLHYPEAITDDGRTSGNMLIRTSGGGPRLPSDRGTWPPTAKQLGSPGSARFDVASIGTPVRSSRNGRGNGLAADWPAVVTTGGAVHRCSLHRYCRWLRVWTIGDGHVCGQRRRRQQRPAHQSGLTSVLEQQRHDRERHQVDTHGAAPESQLHDVGLMGAQVARAILARAGCCSRMIRDRELGRLRCRSAQDHQPRRDCRRSEQPRINIIM
mgnify:CR=1 FL=1